MVESQKMQSKPLTTCRNMWYCVGDMGHLADALFFIRKPGRERSAGLLFIR